MTTEEINDEKYRIRMNREVYSNFVKPDKLKSDIVIAPSHVDFVEYPIRVTGFQSQENFQIQCAPDMLISSAIENGYKSVDFTASNIKFSCDPVKGLYLQQVLQTGEGPSGTTGIIGKRLLFDNAIGLPHPFVPGVFSFSLDPVHSMCNQVATNWGENGETVSTQLSKTLVDAYRRFHTHDEVSQTNKLLVPDNLKSYLLKNNGLVSFLSKVGAITTGNGAGQNNYKFIDGTNFAPVPKIKNTSLNEIANDYLNQASEFNRGFPDIQNVVFTKQIASPNFTCSGSPATNETSNLLIITPTASVTTLHTYWVGNIPIPTVFSPSDIDLWNISLYDAMFHYDNKNTFDLTCLYVYPEPTPPNTTPPAGRPTFTAEPAGQALNMTFSVYNVSTYLLGDEMSQNIGNRTPYSFHNMSRFIIQKTLLSDVRNLVNFNLPYKSELVGVFKKLTSTNDNGVVVNYPQMNGINLEISITQPYVRLKTMKIAPELKITQTSIIPFLKKSVTPNLLDVKLGGQTWRNLTYNLNKDTRKVTISPLSVSTTLISLAQTPYATMIIPYIGNDSNPAEIMSSSGCRRANFNKLTLKIGNDNPCMLSYTADDILRITKKNGLKNYGADFVRGIKTNCAKVRLQQSYGSAANQVVTCIDNTDLIALEKSLDGTFDTIINGSVAFMVWGEDIPLGSTLVGGMAGLQTTAQWMADLWSDDETSTSLNFIIVDFYEKTLLVDQSSRVTITNNDITKNDYVKILSKWNDFVTSGKIEIKRSNMYGGGIFDDLISRVKSIIPHVKKTIDVVLPHVEKGIDMYKAATRGGAYEMESGGSGQHLEQSKFKRTVFGK